MLKIYIRNSGDTGSIMPVITFAHHKGGTGKTTACLNIAGFLKKTGKKVLIIDCDPQANATSGLGVKPGTADCDIYDVFMSGTEGFKQISLSSAILITETGPDLCPASLDLAGAEPYLYGREDHVSLLKNAIRTVSKKYDAILVDTPPSMGQFLINGLVAADHTVVTMDTGPFALRGVESLRTIFSDIGEHTGKTVIPGMAIVTRGRVVHEEMSPVGEVMSGLKRLLGIPGTADLERTRFEEIMGAMQREFPPAYAIPYDPMVPEAQKRGIPISEYAEDSPAAKEYAEITTVIGGWR